MLAAAILETVPPDTGQAGDWRGSGLVLVVEDEDPVLRFATGMLTTLGFNVVSATDGVGALEVFQRHRDELALVLLDLTMPGMDGEELLSELERGPGRVPIVVSSGHDIVDLGMRLNRDRLAGFLQKPYRLEEMRATLQDALVKR
jgi:CheY-like chemotaxis protein